MLKVKFLNQRQISCLGLLSHADDWKADRSVSVEPLHPAFFLFFFLSKNFLKETKLHFRAPVFFSIVGFASPENRFYPLFLVFSIVSLVLAVLEFGNCFFILISFEERAGIRYAKEQNDDRCQDGIGDCLPPFAWCRVLLFYAKARNTVICFLLVTTAEGHAVIRYTALCSQ